MVSINPAPERLDALVDECLRLAAPRLAQAGVSITRQFGADLPEHPVDAALFREAVGCLLDEAIRRAGPEKRLRVTLKANRNAMMLAVKAPGPGLGDVQREVVFTGEARPGTLARARAIVAAHGGVAWANGLPGRGITYYITLPIRRSG